MAGIEVRDIVQLDPEKTKNPAFAGCLMVVTNVKNWGVMGYVTIPGSGDAYYRAETGTFEVTGGKVKWIAD